MAQATTCLKQGDGGESPSALPPPPGSPHIFPPETLFRQAGGVTYRIPALLYVPPDDSFLAFAEKRSSARDEDAKYLVLRRGRRHGCSVKWGPVEELSALTLPRHRTMNPCPLYDARSGTVFLFCICVEWGKSERRQIWSGCSAARLCFASSADGGRGWSALRDVTGEAIGADLARWATFAVGPGHGVQLGSGRLVVPAYAYYVHGFVCGALRLPCFTRQHSLVFYSDDGGRRWHRGELLGGERTGECQVAEIGGAQPGGCQVAEIGGAQPGGCQVAEVRGAQPGGCQVAEIGGAQPGRCQVAEVRGAQPGECQVAEIGGAQPGRCQVAETGGAQPGRCQVAEIGGAKPGRCQVAEVRSAQPPVLYCSARAPSGCRAVALSADQGLRFQRPAPCPALGEPPQGCQGSVLSFAHAGSPWLLYSHPTDRRGRRDLGLYVNPSPLDGAGWRRPWLLHAGPAGYSDLALSPGPVFACLFECGASSACEQIAFCLFTLDLSGEQDLKAS